MTNNTKLNNDVIKKILLENYNIKAIDIEKINRGTADIFKIQADTKKYILKYFSLGRTEESVIKEIEIINFLKGKNIKVPIYINTIQNEYYIVFENRIIILQKYIDGYTMENNTGDYNKVIESAMILGKVTKALQDYKELSEDGIIEKSFSKASIQNGIMKMRDLQQKLNNDNPYKKIFYNDLDFKINIAKELELNFNFDVIDKMTIINSHGDYSVQQLIYNDENETTIIDFETAKKMPIVWEVIRSYSYVDKESIDGELNIDTLIEYFKEFSKYLKLNKYDLKYAGHLYLLQLVASVFGYKQFNDNYENTQLLHFAIFRTKLCRYLYKHLEEISNRLEKEIN